MTRRGLEQSMTPCLVPPLSLLGRLEGGTNMVVIEDDQVGQVASTVMGDVVDAWVSDGLLLM